MFRFLLVACLLSGPALVFSYSAGAPKASCDDLTPKHHVDSQSSSPPYELTGPKELKSGESITLTLRSKDNATFMGFLIQARDAVTDKKIGEFIIVDSQNSQILDCDGPNTVTHRKIPKEKAIKKLEAKWKAPNDYKGNVKFYSTVVENGGTFWVKKVQWQVNVV